jgi:TPR repeat protein
MSKKMLFLAVMCLLPFRQYAGMTEPEQKQFQEVKALADSDDYEALTKLGVLYAMGVGVERDMHKAVACLKFASMQGVPSARYFLGVCYIRGEGVLKDEIEAFAYWSLAYQHEQAQKQLVALNEQFSPATKKIAKDRVSALSAQLNEDKKKWQEGPGRFKDYEKTKRLALQGDPEAQVRYSRYFLSDSKPYFRDHVMDERFERKDFKQADAWCRKAADQNYPDAFAELAMRYLIGNGVEKNNVTFVSYLKRAAELGHTGCQSVLGDRYLEGDGIAKSTVEAYAYFKLSQNSVKLNELRSKMTPEAIAEGDRRAVAIQSDIDRRLGRR